MRLIDADALKASLGESPENWMDTPEEIQAVNDFYSFQDLIDAQPTVNQWIPCSERLPDDLEEVNVTWVNHNPVTYYDFTKDKPFTATAVYYRKKWHWYSSVCADILAEYGGNEVDEIDDAIEIIAWMPLPEPYKPDDFSQHMNPPED